TAFCAGHCGSGSPMPGPTGSCYCDTDCISKGDCCPDYSKTCGTGKVACDGDLCDRSASQFCCHNYNGGWNSSCASDGKVCSGSSYCDGPEDCDGGKVCCGKVNTTYNYFSSMSCQTAASCNYDQNYRVICGPSKQCPSGFVCKPSGSPTGYWYCGKPA
ncbi:MAG: hypothetical protein HYZ29_36410, partial [Myxococcales bacterium]|nr:hypothetical protein [Myxococcales bacterium]